jgi:cytochrome c
MWKVDGKPDVHNIRCMQNCPQEMQQMSTLPDYARNQHGDLSAQNRQIGAVRGTDTTRPAGAVALIASATLPPVKGNALSGHELAQKHTCAACHQSVGKLVGPSHAEISAKYAGNAAAEAMLMAKVRAGGSGVWGSNVMPPHAGISDEDLRALVRWSLAGGN